MKRVYYGILIFFISVSITYPDVFRLKNGEVIEGELISEDDKGVVIKVRYGTIKIDRSEIISPDYEPPKKEIKPVEIPKFPIKATKHEFIPSRCNIGTGFTTEENLQGMHRWLEGQMHPKTGLLESYRPTSDVYLEKQASTYDQALAGLSFLVLGDIKKAQAILDFYKAKWNGNGFSNFYFTPTGNPGIEGIAHLGPNLWIALLALHYDRIVGKPQYIKLAEDITRWAMGLPHYRGGVAMSNVDEWRAPWTKVVSAENNIDYYAVLGILKNRTKDPKLKEKIREERFGVIDFLQKTVYDRKAGGVYRGFHLGVVDREYALDTVSWLILAVGIEELRRWKIDTERLIAFAERKFLVSDEGIKGFDFTDKRGAFKARRPRMISIEWTLAMVSVYCMYRDYYYKLADEQRRIGNIKKAGKLYRKTGMYENKAVYYLREMDKTCLRRGPEENFYSYPYATRSYWLVFYDSPWWKTPKAGTDGTPAGSVASTTWRIFAGRFNPLGKDGGL